jgi:hypothetical protein
MQAEQEAQLRAEQEAQIEAYYRERSPAEEAEDREWATMAALSWSLRLAARPPDADRPRRARRVKRRRG